MDNEDRHYKVKRNDIHYIRTQNKTHTRTNIHAHTHTQYLVDVACQRLCPRYSTDLGLSSLEQAWPMAGRAGFARQTWENWFRPWGCRSSAHYRKQCRSATGQQTKRDQNRTGMEKEIYRMIKDRAPAESRPNRRKIQMEWQSSSMNEWYVTYTDWTWLILPVAWKRICDPLTSTACWCSGCRHRATFVH